MKRGSVYWVNLEPSNPPEFGKVRPGLVVSNTEHNIRIPTVVIIPLSTRAPEIWPLRLAVPLSKGKESFAVLPGIRQVNKARLYEVIALLPQSFLLELDEALRIYLSE